MVNRRNAICRGRCNSGENGLRTSICGLDGVRRVDLSRIGDIYVISVVIHTNAHSHDVHLAIAKLMQFRVPCSLVITHA